MARIHGITPNHIPSMASARLAAWRKTERSSPVVITRVIIALQGKAAVSIIDKQISGN